MSESLLVTHRSRERSKHLPFLFYNHIDRDGYFVYHRPYLDGVCMQELSVSKCTNKGNICT